MIVDYPGGPVTRILAGPSWEVFSNIQRDNPSIFFALESTVRTNLDYRAAFSADFSGELHHHKVVKSVSGFLNSYRLELFSRLERCAATTGTRPISMSALIAMMLWYILADTNNGIGKWKYSTSITHEGVRTVTFSKISPASTGRSFTRDIATYEQEKSSDPTDEQVNAAAVASVKNSNSLISWDDIRTIYSSKHDDLGALFLRIRSDPSIPRLLTTSPPDDLVGVRDWLTSAINQYFQDIEDRRLSDYASYQDVYDGTWKC